MEHPDRSRVRALLAADHAYHRARRLRRIAVTALAAAGSAAWIAWTAGGDSMRHVLLATWLALLLVSIGALIAEVSTWRRWHAAIEATKR